jgi:4-carboxymuconolactone decarboxylase
LVKENQTNEAMSKVALNKYFIALLIGLCIVDINTMAQSASETLNAKASSIVAIAAFTANGDQSNLSNSLHEGLDAGLSVNQIKEIVIQLYAYAGFPRSLNALHTFMAVLKERKQKGMIDDPGRSASPIPTNVSRLAFGTEIQTRLVGAPVKGEVYEFAPAIDQFLKEHLFGDIFGRNILDFKTREIATLAALSTLGGVNDQLRAHFNVGMHNGLTKDQLSNIVWIIQTKVDKPAGNNAATVLRKLLGDDSVSTVHTNNSNFVGVVSVNMLITPDSLFNTQMASVTFEAGARTNWHYHPSGQILMITDGSAYYQEKGKPKQILSKGQVVKCLPNVYHWHGATQNGSMTHLAINQNLQMGSVVWLQKVTDEEYESKK